jgi:hypothetical protein
MATYKFEQFKVEITNPTTEVKLVNDNIIDKVCSVEIILTTDTAKFGVQLDGFTYAETWEDADVLNWVTEELKKYEV